MSATIEVSTATSTDSAAWDSFVHSHPKASPYHLFSWGKAITQAYGHDLVYLLARQEKKVVGVLPMIHLKYSFLLNELVALPFCDLGSCLAVSSREEKKLLVEAVKIGEKLNVKSIQLRGQFKNDLYPDSSFTIIESDKVRMLLELPESSEVLLKSFKSKLRSQVRKSEKNGVIFRWAGIDGVDSFYSVFCSNMRDLGSPVHSRKLFYTIVENYGENARIGLTEFEGKCIGAGLILSTREQTSIPWASTLREYNRLGPNMLLYWNCLKFATDNGKHKFDFGRSTKGEGTFRFKKQWGAKPVPLPWYSSSVVIQNTTKAKSTSMVGRENVVEVWKKIPVPIANLVGPCLRKYINL